MSHRHGKCHTPCHKSDIICHPSRFPSRYASRCPSRHFGTLPRKALECRAWPVGRSDTISGSLPLFTGVCPGIDQQWRVRPSVKRKAEPGIARRYVTSRLYIADTAGWRTRKDSPRMRSVEQLANDCSTVVQQRYNKKGDSNDTATDTWARNKSCFNHKLRKNVSTGCEALFLRA